MMVQRYALPPGSVCVCVNQLKKVIAIELWVSCIVLSASQSALSANSPGETGRRMNKQVVAAEVVC